jgi:hypothetical protein
MNREEKIKLKIEQANIKCIHNIVDGCGNYCSLMPAPATSDYPHKFWRTDCNGRYTSCKDKNLYEEK